jgi:hypothetical protein
MLATDTAAVTPGMPEMKWPKVDQRQARALKGIVGADEEVADVLNERCVEFRGKIVCPRVLLSHVEPARMLPKRVG